MFYYHQQTKHSYASVRSNPNYLEWEKQPVPFKIYNEFIQMIKLDDTNEIHKFIYRLGGITAKKVYPETEYFLRTIPSAGALYPVEFYCQIRGEAGFEDGIYHFDVRNSALKLLHRLGVGEGVEVYFEDKRRVKGFLFLLSTVYYRSSWKYKHRAFRYCLLDAGHGLGTLEASGYLIQKACVVRYQFDKLGLNEVFGFSNKEFFLSSVMVGSVQSDFVNYLDLHIPPINAPIEENPLIEQAYKDSVVLEDCKKQYSYEPFGYDYTRFEEAVMKRRSIREFGEQSISKGAMEVILENLHKNILSDCDEKVNIYYVVNRVDGVEAGLYHDSKLLKGGDFSQEAGYLCLEQSLGRQSAMTFFLTTNAKNYQCAYQKAGHMGHRLYMVSEYLGLGCSGIGAYYDDETDTFLETDEMVLYAFAIGM